MGNKKENLLNIALETTLSERVKSLDLNVGYDEVEKTWEIIVRYTGLLSELKNKFPEILIEELANNYAIIVTPERILEEVVADSIVDYAEKSKNYFFGANTGKAAACINPLQIKPYNFFGKDILVAVLDSGIDIYHRDFQNSDDTTRIVALWDQTIQDGTPPEGYLYGQLYTREEINKALKLGRTLGKRIVNSSDNSGHGTAVAGILAGNGAESDGKYSGIASESELIIVKLGNENESFPKTTRIMEGIDYAIKVANNLNKPVAINLSFGNNYGSHDGDCIFENYIDEMSVYSRNAIVVGAGNEGNTGIHTSGTISPDKRTIVEFSVGEYEPKLYLQLWKSYVDDFDVEIITPRLERIGPLRKQSEVNRYDVFGNTILTYYGMPNPFDIRQEIYIDFIPKGTYVQSGLYKIFITPRSIADGFFDMWMPSSVVIGNNTRFLTPTAEGTFTVPSTTKNVISVGAYNPRLDIYADFSGRGFEKGRSFVKPDIVADGVNVITTRAGGGYLSVSGTSFSTPFVTGGAALLMEWGIVRGNDPFMYGQKLKGNLIKGAKKIGKITEYPSNMVGWGSLCVSESIPI